SSWIRNSSTTCEIGPLGRIGLRNTPGGIDLNHRATNRHDAQQTTKPPATGKPVEVTSVEDLHRDAGLAASPQRLAPLAVRQRLAHDGALDVEVEVGKVEVGRQGLANAARPVALEDERMRLVQPRDPVCVENACELTLDGMREGGNRVLDSFPPVRVAPHLIPQRHALFRVVRKRRVRRRRYARPSSETTARGGLVAEAELEVPDSPTAGVVVVEIVGELDLTNAPEFERRLDELSADASMLVVDLNHVSFIDSAALHVLFRIVGRLGTEHVGLVLDPG